MIENNIIQSLGAGSGIDSKSLVGQLVEIEKFAPQKRIDDKKELTEAQISDFGLIKSSLATLQTAAETVTGKEGLFSKSASFTDSDALIPSDLSTDVATGTYNFVVTGVAQSQSLSSTPFSSTLDPVGEGTLTFRFGDWDAGVTAFTEDISQSSQDIVIDGSNNTLKGLKDAINDAEIGVQASIIEDGSGDYRLLFTATSGENNQLEITVAESGGTPTNDDDSGLSRFSFNDTDPKSGPADTVHTQQMTQNQAGADSEFTVNGLAISRSTNKIDDVVDGLTFEILQAAPTETVTVTITDDKTFAEQNVRDLVDAYNTFLEEVDKVFGLDEETGEKGSLANDSLAKSVLSQIRNTISAAIPGLSGSNFSALTNVGIRTELDGTLSINETDFESAFADNFEDVQSLFAPTSSSSASDITVNSFGGQTVPGNYDVAITTTPAKGYFDTGVVTLPIDATASSYSFVLSVNGTESDNIIVPAGVTYSDGDELAEIIQQSINADSVLQAAGASVTVGWDSVNTLFTITSNKYGSSSVVNVTSASIDAINELGIAAGSGTAGRDVAGTIDGVAGFGLGNVLLPALGEDAEGLTLLVGEAATTATVNYSKGFAGELDSLVDDFLSSTGLLVGREAALEADLGEVDDDQEELDRKMGIFEERLIRQFIAMEQILNSFSSSGGFLENLIDTLPFTARRD